MRLCTWNETVLHASDPLPDFYTIEVQFSDADIPCDITTRSILRNQLMFPLSTAHLPELLAGEPCVSSGMIVDTNIAINFQQEAGILFVGWTDSENNYNEDRYLVVLSEDERKTIVGLFRNQSPEELNISRPLYAMQWQYAEGYAIGRFLYSMKQ